MNAIKFIKEHGVEMAREVVEGAPEGSTHIRDSYGFIAYLKDGDRRERYHENTWLITLIWLLNYLLSDLKRLVESVELVEHFGNDLVGAKQLLEFSKDCKTIELSGSVITVERLKQAVADYEAIYSNDCEILDHPEDYTSPNCKKFDERVE